jgi:hypothetical protein
MALLEEGMISRQDAQAQRFLRLFIGNASSLVLWEFEANRLGKSLSVLRSGFNQVQGKRS